MFLQIMLAFLSHSNLNLAASTADFWTALFKEGHGGGSNGKEAKEGSGQASVTLPDGFLSALLDVLTLRLQKPQLDTLEDYPVEYYESYKDFHEKSSLLRQRMIELSRQIVMCYPEQVFQACLRNLGLLFSQVQQTAVSNQTAIEAPLEAATHLLYTATNRVSVGVSANSPSLEALLPKLLTFPIGSILTSDILMQFIRCLESLGGHGHRIVPAVQCLLGILQSSAGLSIPREHTYAARQQAATTILALTLRPNAATILSQHLSPLMEQIQTMWTSGVIRPGERNALYEAVLLISIQCGPDQLQKVIQVAIHTTPCPAHFLIQLTPTPLLQLPCILSRLRPSQP